jgi:serine/threonine protein phosphatase 1
MEGGLKAVIKGERIFVIGDIHGCLGMLDRLVKRIDWDPGTDRLIFLGDYIDRGEDSKGVIDYIVNLSRESGKVDCLLGNHEAIFLDYLSGVDSQTFLDNGGKTTLCSYGIADGPKEIPPAHMGFLKGLKPFLEMEEYYIVHAGLRPGVSIERQSPEDLMWIRDTFILSEYDFGKRVIFGHTPFSQPLIMDNKIGLDTGAVYGNRLTCLELPAFSFHQVDP